jgi:exoribonuclease-2
MLANGFLPDFSPEAAEELRRIRGRALPKPDAEIRDLRGLLFSSIDNENSRDLDQVEYAEMRSDGVARLLVGIADVDHFVEKGSAIDRRAERNTVTIYTETEVFPLLPPELSFDLTSLRENEDRLAVVCEMNVTPDGDVPESTFYRALIRNRAKLAYEQVGEWLEGRAAIPQKIEQIDGLAEQIRLQFEIAERLQKYRSAKGALTFESIEARAVVEGGEVRQIKRVEPNSARRLIENLMIAANVEMAEFLEREGVASIRRVIRVPKDWAGIVRIARQHGQRLPEEPNQGALQDFLVRQRAADPLHFPDLSLAVVKLIGSGEYVVQRKGEDAGGHFGLAVRDYAHSTAPNRRYADIVVQRLVKAAIAGRLSPYSPDELDSMAAHLNKQEKAARRVERKMRKIVAASVLRRHVGERFDAIVTGRKDGEAFVRTLKPPVDGMLVRGEEKVRVGDKVRVELVSANPSNGFIDFALA